MARRLDRTGCGPGCGPAPGGRDEAVRGSRQPQRGNMRGIGTTSASWRSTGLHPITAFRALAIPVSGPDGGRARWRAEKITLLKPGTFMNLSGQSVGEAVRFFKLTPADITVFHDELDLAPGQIAAGSRVAGMQGTTACDRSTRTSGEPTMAACGSGSGIRGIRTRWRAMCCMTSARRSRAGSMIMLQRRFRTARPRWQTARRCRPFPECGGICGSTPPRPFDWPFGALVRRCADGGSARVIRTNRRARRLQAD